MALDHHYIEEHNIAERYLRRTLPPSERAQFEAHFPDCPECLDRLALAEVFRGAKAEPVSGEASRVERSVPASFLKAWFQATLQQRRIATALTLLFLCGSPLAFVTGVYFGILGAQKEALRASLVFDPGPQQYGVQDYTIAIVSPQGRIVKANAGVALKPGQKLAIPANFTDLPAGDFLLTVRARRIDGSLETVARYPIHNQRP